MAIASIMLIHSGEAEDGNLWDIVAAEFSPQQHNSSAALREDRLNLNFNSANRPSEGRASYTPLTQGEAGENEDDPLIVSKKE